jgi:hypothetical protein
LKKVRYLRRFGGSSEDMAGFNGESLKLDLRANLWIGGQTRSIDLDAQGRSMGDGDGFLVSFGPDGRRQRFATYFGGTGSEMIEGVALAPAGSVWASGFQLSAFSCQLDSALERNRSYPKELPLPV